MENSVPGAEALLPCAPKKRWDGYPLNPEQKGWHWLEMRAPGKVLHPFEWSDELAGEGEFCWLTDDDGDPHEMAKQFRYYAPQPLPQAPYAASPAAVVTEAIHAGCIAANVHLTCTYPECHCAAVPIAVKAALSTFSRAQPSEAHKLDDPEMDATDYAHPAWWRGHDHTALVMLAHAVKALGRKPEAGLHWQGALEAIRALAQPSEAGAGEAVHLRAALEDMLAGWRYIRRHHGDLSGVGWDRAEAAAIHALALPPSVEPAGGQTDDV